MKYLILETFTDFKCIGSACPFTCCAGGWRIIIDPETDKYYKSVTGDFGDRLRQSIKEAKGNSCFTLTEDGRCSFLNEDNLCDIYINLGEEHLCYTCTVYPRYFYSVGDIQFAGVTISCPEVARFMLQHKEPLQIDFAEDKKKLRNESGVDWTSFNHAIRSFTTSVGIAQERGLSINERLAVLTIFIKQFQSCIEDKRDPSGFVEAFSDHSNFAQIQAQIGVNRNDLSSKLIFCSKIFSYIGQVNQSRIVLPELYELIICLGHDGKMSLEADKLLMAYEALGNEEAQVWMEQLVVYSLHRYFMQGFSKKDYYTKFLIGILLFFELCRLTVVLYYCRWGKMPSLDELVLIVAHTSRFVEHDDTFRDSTIQHFMDEGMDDPAYLLKLFS